MAMNKIKMLVERLEELSKMSTPHSDSYYKIIRDTIKEIRQGLKELDTEVDYEQYGDSRKQFAETFGNADTFFNQWK